MDVSGGVVVHDEEESMFSPNQIALNKRMIREFYEAHPQIVIPLSMASYLVVAYLLNYLFPSLFYIYMNFANLGLFLASPHKRFPKYKDLLIVVIIINCSLSTLQQLATDPYTLVYFIQLFSTLMFVNE